MQIVDVNDENNSIETTTAGVRGRGNSTWSLYPKKPYRIKFDKKQSLFGLPKAKSWVLLANYQDPTLLMNIVAFELGHRLGIPFTNHYIPVELVLNGEHKGNYLLTEQVQVGEGRVNIDENEGFLLSLDVGYDEEPKFKSGVIGLPVMIKSPEDLDDPNGYDFVKESVNELVNALFNESFPEGYRELIDMSSFIDFLLVNEVVKNEELSWPKSAYMYKDKNQKISMGPLWDFDWGFAYSGNYDQTYFTFIGGRSYTYQYNDSKWIGGQFFCRFFDDPLFRGLHRDRWNEVKTIIESIPEFIDSMAIKLAPSQAVDVVVWDRPRDYEADINAMKTWWKSRVAMLDEQINILPIIVSVNAPIFEPYTDGQEQPEPKIISIKNIGDMEAVISSVTISEDSDFIITNIAEIDTNITIELDEVVFNWTIQPKANLSTGEHSAKITVNYYNGTRYSTATATVFVKINAIPEIEPEPPMPIFAGTNIAPQYIARSVNAGIIIENAPANAKITVYDTQGRIVGATIGRPNNRATIPVPASGLYFVKIQNGSQVHTQGVVVR
ncbi:hypothetical protein AGMMS49938_18610 [Fibrobacterales bacterium]|nr:hypothetical protein AGMMS49938_18610 [Fibrobacterales bacterium]